MEWTPNIYYGAPIQSSIPESKRIAKFTIKVLQQHGKVLTEHIGFDDVLSREKENTKNGVNICNRDFRWLGESDVLVLDISNASTGVGFEGAYNLLGTNLPMLVVRKRDLGTKMFTELAHPLQKIKEYGNDNELNDVITGYLKDFRASHRLFERFTMIDAGDGAGKGAVYRAIKTWCDARGIKSFDCVDYWTNEKNPRNHLPTWAEVQDMVPGCGALFLAEPTYQGIGKVIREEITLKDRPRPYSSVATAHAFALDRDVLYKLLVIDALESGALVVSDRGVITSDVYQPVQAELFEGYSQAFFRGFVRGLPGNQQAFRHAPGLFVIPRVPLEEQMRRLNKRVNKNDNSRFETKNFQSAIAEVYADPALRSWYERRGSTITDLIVPAGELSEITQARALVLFENYATQRGL